MIIKKRIEGKNELTFIIYLNSVNNLHRNDEKTSLEE